MPTRWYVLAAAGVSVVLDVADGRLPAIVHWGADLGELTAADLTGLVAAQAPPFVAPNAPDVPVRLAVLPEAATGWAGHPGLSGSRSGRDWSPRWTLGGVRAEPAPSASAGEPSLVALGAARLRFEAEDAACGLGLVLEIELTGQGLLRSRATVTNRGDADYQLDELLLAYPVPARAREVLDFGGRWLKERVPQRLPLAVGAHRRESRHGRPGHDSAFVLHVGTPGFGFADGEVWAVHTAWSGNTVHYAERVVSGDQVVGGGELLLPGEVILAPGASYASPWLFGSWGRGLDAVAARFHAWVRDARPLRPRPVTLNVWEAVYFEHDLDRLVALAERAASVGVERFVLDDGWFGARRHDRAGLGDWVVSPDVWPQGLHPLIDRVHALGLEFGLWFEPEMVNPDSDVARAHPDWVLQPGHGRLPVEWRFQQVLNLAHPDAYAHVRDAMVALLDEYRIAYLKWDHNRDLIEAGATGRPAVRAQTLSFYRLLDELRDRYPALEIESCASGGGRVDLEVMTRAERVWVSDCIDPHERAALDRWTGQLLPPERLGSHIGAERSHTTRRRHDLGFRAAVALWGHLGVEWDLTAATADELGELAAWIAFHREHRGVLHSGRVVRVDAPGPGLSVHGVVTPERALFAFVGTQTSDAAGWGVVGLPGLDPDARYRVRVGGPVQSPHPFAPAWVHAPDGLVLTGAVLAAGLRVPVSFPDEAVVVVADRLA